MNLSPKTQQLRRIIARYPNNAHTKTSYHQMNWQLRLTRHSSEFLFVVLLQWVGLKLDIFVVPTPNISLVAALNLILVFWRGYRLWSSLWFGGGVFWWWQGLPLLHAVGMGLLHMLCPITILAVIHRTVGALIPFPRLRDWFAYVIISSLVVSAVIWLQGQLCDIESHRLLQDGLTRINAYLLLTSAALIWGSYPFFINIIPRQRLFEGLTLLTASLVCYLLIFYLLSHRFLFILLLVNGLLVARLSGRIGLYGMMACSSAVALGDISVTILRPIFALQAPNDLLLTLYFYALTSLGYGVAIVHSRQRKVPDL